MDVAKIAAFAVALAVVCGLVFVQQIRMKRRLKSRLAGRETVPAAEFGFRNYTDAARAEIATFILQKIEEITGYDFTGALPTDRWSDDLHIDELDSLVSVEIIQEVEQRFGIVIDNADAKQVKTLGDFVVVYAKRNVATPRPFSATPRE
jgi:acyl carrier protein